MGFEFSPMRDGVSAWKGIGAPVFCRPSPASGGRALADLVASLLRGQYLVGYQLWRPDDPGCGPNPYLGYLAHADAVVATDDGVTMISEAMTAGRPVYLWGAARGRPAKHQAFFDRMQGRGACAPGTAPAGLAVVAAITAARDL